VVPVPDLKGREGILKVHLRKKLVEKISTRPFLPEERRDLQGRTLKTW
jgi:ATP-dependent Zn protease